MSVANLRIVEEILRTLSRLDQSPLVTKYRIDLVATAERLYGPDLRQPFPLEVTIDKSDTALTQDQKDQIEGWLRDAPWYLFSLVVGLAAGEESLAWGLAYG